MGMNIHVFASKPRNSRKSIQKKINLAKANLQEK